MIAEADGPDRGLLAELIEELWPLVDEAGNLEAALAALDEPTAVIAAARA